MSGTGEAKLAEKVLDSWAILAFFEGEPAGKMVEDLLQAAVQNRMPLLMTGVNVGEVWYSIAHTRGDAVADQAVENILTLGIEIVPADLWLSLQAARFKVRIPVACADCYAAALAQARGCELVTGGPEFIKFQDHLRLSWLA